MSKTLNRSAALAKIDRGIAEGERHVAEQIALIQWMRQGCLDTTLAQSLRCHLEQVVGHRQLDGAR